MRSKFKLAIIFAIISLSVGIVNGFFGAFKLLDRTVFESVYNVVMMEGFEILPTDELYVQMYDSIQVLLIVFSFVGGLLCIPGLVLSILCVKHHSLSIESFDRKRTLHIWTLIMIGIGFFSMSNGMGSSVNYLISMLSGPSEILIIIAFFMMLYEVRLNKRQMRLSNRYSNEYPTKTFSKENVIDVTPVVTKSPEELEKEKQEKEEKLQKYEELYSLLAKLEKSYKNNEITEEDYKRMKETILSNFNNI